MFHDLFTSMMVELANAVGYPLAIAIFAFGGMAILAALWWGASWASEWLMGEGPSMATREREEQTKSLEVKRKKLAAMNDIQVMQIVEQHPADVPAIEEACRRLKQKGNFDACAAMMERLIDLRRREEVDKVCLLYHQLADVYAGSLNDRSRARETLERFITEHPGTPQAHVTEERIQRI